MLYSKCYLLEKITELPFQLLYTFLNSTIFLHTTCLVQIYTLYTGPQKKYISNGEKELGLLMYDFYFEIGILKLNYI